MRIGTLLIAGLLLAPWAIVLWSVAGAIRARRRDHPNDRR
jgi:hypothetical protein